ncbi:MAG: DUF6064 family protein [Loktanella sp.]|nr:DUF6064 family protein [Loktanella sp.]
METWLSYAPSDFLMFGPEVYWRLFELQNRALWPLPVIAGLAGLACLMLLATQRPVAIRSVLMLAALACLGAAHFLATRYAPINWPMVYAAWGFGLQAVALTLLAVIGSRKRFDKNDAAATATGWALLGYATILHPFVGLAFGRPLAQAEIVGITPDPTALACLGLLNLMLPGCWGIACATLPFLWCVFSAATLLTLSEPQGWILIAALLLWFLGRSTSVFIPCGRA